MSTSNMFSYLQSLISTSSMFFFFQSLMTTNVLSSFLLLLDKTLPMCSYPLTLMSSSSLCSYPLSLRSISLTIPQFMSSRMSISTLYPSYKPCPPIFFLHVLPHFVSSDNTRSSAVSHECTLSRSALQSL